MDVDVDNVSTTVDVPVLIFNDYLTEVVKAISSKDIGILKTDLGVFEVPSIFVVENIDILL